MSQAHAAGIAISSGWPACIASFHTPADDVSTTSPEILEPVARAFTEAVRKAAERGERAFK